MTSVTSSGSSFSLMAVKPETSAKRMVTTRLSPLSVGLGEGGAFTGAAARGAPQAPQNLKPGASGVPHVAHGCCSPCPQEEQKRWSSFTGVWQWGHAMASLVPIDLLGEGDSKLLAGVA